MVKAYQAFQLLESVTTTPPDVLEFARPFIARSRWMFAKTMPEHPHEYVLRADCYQAGYEPDFVTMVELIRQHGYKGRFYRNTLTYMNVDDWRYWSMGWPIRRYAAPPAFDYKGRAQWPADETMLINRARNDDR